jgi:predicted Rossmann fold nucleotide-binding protein DprA/Smf involved in DNA uptake
MTSLQVWTTILGLLVLIAGGVIGLSKWNQRRIDRRVLDYMEKHARKHSDGSRSRSLADITQALGVPEKLVMEALIRLRKAGKVRTHGENWVLI